MTPNVWLKAQKLPRFVKNRMQEIKDLKMRELNFAIFQLKAVPAISQLAAYSLMKLRQFFLVGKSGLKRTRVFGQKVPSVIETGITRRQLPSLLLNRLTGCAKLGQNWPTMRKAGTILEIRSSDFLILASHSINSLKS